MIDETKLAELERESRVLGMDEFLKLPYGAAEDESDRRRWLEREFTRAARNALPELLAEVRALRRVAETAREAATKCSGHFGGPVSIQREAFEALCAALADLDRGTR